MQILEACSSTWDEFKVTYHGICFPLPGSCCCYYCERNRTQEIVYLLYSGASMLGTQTGSRRLRPEALLRWPPIPQITVSLNSISNTAEEANLAFVADRTGAVNMDEQKRIAIY